MNQDALIENLKKELDEKEKLIAKSKNKHTEELNELKRQQMLTSENLRSTVLEKEVLKENDRILLNTFDMMKQYIDQMKEQYSKKNSAIINTDEKCKECDHIAKSNTELNVHMETMHQDKRFECKKCYHKFVSEPELSKHLETKHIEKETHGKQVLIKCKHCEYSSKNNEDLKKHENEHRSDELFECDQCQFDSIIKPNFEWHMKTQHGIKSRNTTTPCRFWNQGHCQYNRECRYSHEEIPLCRFQENCGNYRCPYFHYDKSWNSFLGKDLRILSKQK